MNSLIKVINAICYNQEQNECDLVLTDGYYNILCYSYPCVYKKNDNINSNLYCCDSNHVYKSYEDKCKIESINKPYSYKIIGKLIDKTMALVKCNEFYFEIDNILIPNDIQLNDIIEFTCSKIIAI